MGIASSPYTVPSPEREEIEVKIHELYNSGDTVRGMLENMATFSARRAREKAIEECYEKLKGIKEPQFWEEGQDWLSLETIREKFDELKSTTN